MQALGTPAYLAAYPEALTTALEGLSKEEKWGMQTLADEWNEEGPPSDKRESKYHFLHTPHLNLHVSLHVEGMPASFPKVIKAFLADIKRTNGCPRFHDGGVYR